MFDRIKYLISEESNVYQHKYMRMIINSTNDLPLKKNSKYEQIVILTESVFNNNHNQYYPKCFRKNTLIKQVKRYKSQSIFQPPVCDGWHDLQQNSLSFDDTSVVTVGESSYRILFWCITESEALRKMNNSENKIKIHFFNYFFYYYFY